MIATNGTTQKIRLYGVMCPVKGQPFHEDARMLTNFLCLQKSVDFTPMYRAADDVVYALVRIDGTKYFLNERLMGYGMAWVKPTECKASLCNEWRKLERIARENAIGLWGAPSPVPPWEWAREKRKDMYHRSREAPNKQE
ncbi:MAG: thermonuclease family protein [Syntrophobacteraceae bacterium]